MPYGRAICAAAAYRSGEKIHDERYGKTFDYTPRTSIYDTEIRAPDHAPGWMKNRSELVIQFGNDLARDRATRTLAPFRTTWNTRTFSTPSATPNSPPDASMDFGISAVWLQCGGQADVFTPVYTIPAHANAVIINNKNCYFWLLGVHLNEALLKLTLSHQDTLNP